VEPLTSTRNPRVRALADLRRARHRREAGVHLVEGPHAVGEALAAGVVTELLATEEGLASLDQPPDVPVTPVAEHVLARITDTATPQGVVAVARSVTADLDAVVGEGLLVVLAAVGDPGNVGTIVRTADAVGAAGVVLTAGCADVFGPKAVRAAAGSTYHLPLVVGPELGEVVATCSAAGQPLYGLDGGATVSVFALPHTGPAVALVLGNEAHGLPPDTRGLLDAIVAVPIRGRAESLNVAAAAAVALYAASEQLTGD
jgi:RNA methyltransferase, TrmH family